MVSSHEAVLPARRNVEDQPLTFEYEPTDRQTHVVIARHASDAVSFAVGDILGTGMRGARKRRAAKSTDKKRSSSPQGVLRFRITTQSSATATGRRGPVSKVIKFVVVKIMKKAADKVADFAIEKLASLWETRTWKKKKIVRGFQQVQVGADGTLSLVQLKNSRKLPEGRKLLFIHGTFSNFQGGFGALGKTRGADGQTFFDKVRATYGERIYAFNHFTVSETAEANGRDLMLALSTTNQEFDVITHSRGALVLRTILESAELAPLAKRFSVGNVVLVAGPNEGTPLASPDRWHLFTDWIGNVIDLFPDNPFTTGADFLVESVAWLAGKVGDVIPGLATMNPRGPLIDELQSLPHPAGTWSALASNHEPSEGVVARMVDVGVDGFFGMANDLVVPTRGGWRVGTPTMTIVGNDRVGCYGPGGNLRTNGPVDVTHTTFFNQTETVDFLARAVLGQPQGLPTMQLDAELPTKRDGRRGNGAMTSDARGAATPPINPPSTTLPPETDGNHPPRVSTVRPSRQSFLDEVLHLFIVSPLNALAMPKENDSDYGLSQMVANSTKGDTALLIASFRNARVIEPFRPTRGEARDRYQLIDNTHKRIKGYIDGNSRYKSLPSEEELRKYGALLFDSIFPGEVRRLYDTARAELKERRLNVCLTSTIGWVADKPWEFAFDPYEETFICTEEVNFIRNSITAVPADALGARSGKLRILVIAAQPVGAGALSIDEEISMVRSAFEPLIRAGLAEVQVEVDVTPQKLHELLSLTDVIGDRFDVLHFIGHGEFDETTGFGYLLFEDRSGRSHELRADIFRQIAAHRGVRLVFLNACETGTGFGRRHPNRVFDFSSGVAPMLVSGGVPAIVANQFSVLDVSATAFAQHFYWALSIGRTIGDAAREARVAVNYSIAGEAIDWAVPVLFARNPDDVLVPHADTSATAIARMTDLAPATTARRSLTRSTKPTIAIWDLNYVIPELNRVVQRLNDAQEVFVFERANLTAPLGTWRRSRQRNTQHAVLDAAEVETKLKPTLERLGVAQLCCITTMALWSDGKESLSASVSDDGRISIVSTGGRLEKMHAPYTIERFLANALAFSLSEVSTHSIGPKNCPGYYNNEEDIRWDAGPLELCRQCAGKIKKPTRRAAIKGILRAFD